MDKPGQIRQVIHLYFIGSERHFYFGSISAMFENFTKDELGVALQTLYNQWKDEVFQNDKIVIRKGRLVQKKNKRD